MILNAFKSLLFFLLILVVLPLRSDQVIDVLNSQHLSALATIIEDKTHQYSVSNILNEEYNREDVFESSSDYPYLDFTQSTFWLKLEIEGNLLGEDLFYFQTARPLTNEVVFKIFNEDLKEVYHFQTGDDQPFTERAFQHHEFIFPVELNASETYTIIVKARSDGEILKFPLKYWKADDLTEFIGIENFFLGLYYGIFILVIVLFSFFGVALQQKLYLYFVIYVFVLGLFQLSIDGLAYQFLWPKLPWLGNHAILITAAISMLMMLFYVSNFINFSQQPNWYRGVYTLFMSIISVCLGISFTDGFLYTYLFPVLNGISFLAILFILIGIYLKSKQNLKIEKSLLGAFLFLCVGAILFITSNVNIIQSDFLANNALKLGTGGEVTFLALALAGRYRKTQLEKITAQEEANQRLIEINQLKEEQTEQLELQVAERTIQLKNANDELNEVHQEIINSINYAQRLQSAILPSDHLFDSVFNDSMVVYLPKDIVSGDFYWMEELNDKVFFAVADCTGHGVPGAMVSVLGQNSLNRCINEYQIYEAGKILDKLTVLVENTLNKYDRKVNDGMDIAIGVWDKANKLEFAGANNPLYLCRGDELIEIKGDKQPIGRFEKRKPFTTHHIDIKNGDSIYLFSDGYADQFGGEKGKKLKSVNFKKLIQEYNHLPSESIKKNLESFYAKWKKNEEQIDDVCIMNVKF